mgnify:CR=1 FL=1|tara:strand:+ start:728 stop:967 length:240 start_codon:yes stop_codon:yes gene_type:complete
MLRITLWKERKIYAISVALMRINGCGKLRINVHKSIPCGIFLEINDRVFLRLNKGIGLILKSEKNIPASESCVGRPAIF